MRKRIIGVIVALLLSFVIVGGVICWNVWSEVRPIKQVFRLIFSYTEQQLQEVDASETEETMIAWMENRYSEFFTPEGWEDALENRLFFLGIADETVLANVTVDIQKRGEMKNCYIADIYSQGNNTEPKYRVFLQMENVDGTWLITSIDR